MLEVADPLAHRALQALLRAEASVRRALAAELEREGISAAGFSALVVLTTAGGSLELRTLRRRLGWSKANATEVAQTLEARGFVSRRRLTEDRRAVAIDLTVDGRAVVERLFPGHSDRVSETFEALDEGRSAPDGHLPEARRLRPLLVPSPSAWLWGPGAPPPASGAALGQAARLGRAPPGSFWLGRVGRCGGCFPPGRRPVSFRLLLGSAGRRRSSGSGLGLCRTGLGPGAFRLCARGSLSPPIVPRWDLGSPAASSSRPPLRSGVGALLRVSGAHTFPALSAWLGFLGLRRCSPFSAPLLVGARLRPLGLLVWPGSGVQSSGLLFNLL